MNTLLTILGTIFGLFLLWSAACLAWAYIDKSRKKHLQKVYPRIFSE